MAWPAEAEWLAEGAAATRGGQPGAIQRLVWARGHLHRVQPQQLCPAERQEIIRLLTLIQRDVDSLLDALDD